MKRGKAIRAAKGERVALYSIHYAYEYDTSKAVTYVPQLNYNSLKDRVAARGLGIESHDRRLGNIKARERTTDGRTPRSLASGRQNACTTVRQEPHEKRGGICENVSHVQSPPSPARMQLGSKLDMGMRDAVQGRAGGDGQSNA